MMSRQLLQFLVIIGLATQAFSDCRDLTLDSCEEKPAFETYKDLGDETNCQAFCRDIFPDDCINTVSMARTHCSIPSKS